MTINEYFESIKHNKAKLRQFVADMPKGGELHHHLTGAVYAETLFASVLNENKKNKDACPEKLFWVNLDTGKLSVGKPDPKKQPDAENYICLIDETFQPDENSYKKYDFHFTRMTLIDRWSVRDFQPYKYPLGPDEYFFSLFGTFGAATAHDYLPDLVHELKVRAKEENLQYIETMGIAPTVPDNVFILPEDYEKYHNNLATQCLALNKKIESNGSFIRELITEIVKFYEGQYDDKNSDLHKAVDKYVSDNYDILNEIKPQGYITSKFDTTVVSDSDVTMKLQGYASRNSDPLVVLAQLYIIHKAMQVQKDVLKNVMKIENASDVIVGCNIVAAENSENSMLYYKAHMIMFSVLKEWFQRTENDQDVYPNTSLHAGELTMGLIRPEHLTYHISEAVNTAGAKRIGHGVDIVFEHNSSELLKTMAQQKIAVEINLTSNEFILGVKGDSHPFTIYKDYVYRDKDEFGNIKDYKIPVVISTDDPGILRTSITEEYTRAVYRYDLTYAELKEIVSNSITYSFLSGDDDKEESDKGKVRNAYKKALDMFESNIKNIIEHLPKDNQ